MVESMYFGDFNFGVLVCKRHVVVDDEQPSRFSNQQPDAESSDGVFGAVLLRVVTYR